MKNSASPDEYQYHVALSFAEQKRDIALAIYQSLTNAGLSVYYYPNARHETLGKELKKELTNIYGQKARAVIVLASEEYGATEFTKVESKVIRARIMTQSQAQSDQAAEVFTLIPVKTDDTLPSNLGLEEVPGYLHWDYDPDEITREVVAILGLESFLAKKKGKQKRQLRRKIVVGMSLLFSLIFTLQVFYDDIFFAQDWSVYNAKIQEGDSLLALGQYELAGWAYQEALRHGFADSTAYKKLQLLDKAHAYAELDDLDKAQEMFDLILQIELPASDLEVGLTDEINAVSDDGILLTISRLTSGAIEIRVKGGTPFPDPNSPYLVSGLEQGTKIEWRKEGETYIGLIERLSNKSVLSIKVTDSKGQTNSKSIPEASNTQLFAEHQYQADEYFEKSQFARAKSEYEQALHYKESDAYCIDQIEKCDVEIEQIKAKRLDMNYVKGGRFIMGDDDGLLAETPAHEVELSSFYITRHEITVQQYRQFCQANGRQMPPEPSWGWKDDHPIVNVSWEDAKAYCSWVGGRLPTEAEWEYAARGGRQSNGFAYSGSSIANEVSWFRSNTSNQTTQAVGSKPVVNELGCADMSGNVWEWVADYYNETYYSQSKAKNPKGPRSGNERVLRGGSWKGTETYCTVSYRNYRAPSYRSNDTGFRVVMDRKQPDLSS